MINTIASALTIAAQAAIVVVVAQLAATKKGARLPQPARFFGDNALLLAFLAALGAFLGSFYYSNIVGYEPCLLCWYQRIALWPQVLILGLALIKNNDESVADYVLTLSTAGLVIAAFHVYTQFSGGALASCTAFEGAVECSKQYIREFGYVTVPVMSLTTFAGIIASVLAMRRV